MRFSLRSLVIVAALLSPMIWLCTLAATKMKEMYFWMRNPQSQVGPATHPGIK